MFTLTLGGESTHVWSYDPNGEGPMFAKRPETVKVPTGCWHYQYGEGEIIATYHSDALAGACTRCEPQTLDVQNHRGDD